VPSDSDNILFLLTIPAVRASLMNLPTLYDMLKKCAVENGHDDVVKIINELHLPVSSVPVSMGGAGIGSRRVSFFEDVGLKAPVSTAISSTTLRKPELSMRILDDDLSGPRSPGL
jgi:hypothetical protein